jgi:hypothetical protein
MPLSNFVSAPTLAQWNLLINASMTALMVGYGFWIHHVVKQQEKLKDAAIQALQAALTAKEAEISRLTSDTAPNIVKAYQGMREHADKMTADVIKLQEKMRESEEASQFLVMLSEASGLNRGNRILVDKLGKFMRPTNEPPTHQELWQSVTLTSMAIDVESDDRIARVKAYLDKLEH